MKDIKTIAKNILEIEAKAITELAQRLDDSFSLAVDCIQNSKGKIIICGVGKSGLVAKKIAATFTSTGTPCYFLHPTEAIHGDLGMVRKEDCFISISNSGETDEILRLLPAIQSLDIRHVTLVGNPKSSLAKNATVVLDIGVLEEGSELGAVPMASTIVAMAMGDALAAALLVINGFNKDDFAKLHIGGSLGRKLITPVSGLMQKNNLPLCQPQTSIKDVIVQMSSSLFGLVAIVDKDNLVAGIITDGDLRRALNKYPNESFFDLLAKDIMTFQPKTTNEKSSAWEADQIMQTHQITALLITNNNRLLGILGKHQIK